MLELFSLDLPMQLLVFASIVAIWAVFACTVYVHLPHRYIGSLGEGMLSGVIGGMAALVVVCVLLKLI